MATIKSNRKAIESELNHLLDHVEELGIMIGSEDYDNVCTDYYRDKYAEFQEHLERIIRDF